MARPPLPMGTHGSIKVARRAGATSGSYVAKCRVRDYDGVTRLLERSGATKAAASRALQDELRARTGTKAAPLRPEETFERASEIWLTKLDAQVRDGARAVTTADTYRQRLRAVILPAVGQCAGDPEVLRRCRQVAGEIVGGVAVAFHCSELHSFTV